MAVRPASKTPVREEPVTHVPGSWLEDRDKRFVAWGVGVSLVMAAGLGLLMYGLQHFNDSTLDPDAQTLTIKPDYPRHLVDFSLTDQAGHEVTRKDLEGKLVIVGFLFTSCSQTCPFVNAQMQRVQQATAGRADVRLLSLTLDPVDDTVQVLANYAPGFNADPRRWSFLTGDQGAVHRLVSTSFLPPDTTGQFSYMPGNFAHTNRIVLIDKTGRIVSYFDGLNQNAAAAILDQIKTLDSTP
jgi:protein SCO1/2